VEKADLTNAKIKGVILFPNGMIAVTDEFGQQIPELQGRNTLELRTAISGPFTMEDIRDMTVWTIKRPNGFKEDSSED
jgi:hypothetical protein